MRLDKVFNECAHAPFRLHYLAFFSGKPGMRMYTCDDIRYTHTHRGRQTRALYFNIVASNRRTFYRDNKRLCGVCSFEKPSIPIEMFVYAMRSLSTEMHKYLFNRRSLLPDFRSLINEWEIESCNRIASVTDHNAYE